VLSPHISALDEHNKLSTKDNWKKGGKAQAKHSLKGKILLHVNLFLEMSNVNIINVVFSLILFVIVLTELGLGGLVALLFTLCPSLSIQGQCQLTNYVDNWPCAHVSALVHPKHIMGSQEETTMPLLFLHLHEVI